MTRLLVVRRPDLRFWIPAVLGGMALVVALLASSSTRAHAIPPRTLTWTGAGVDNKWSDLANWSSGAPVAGTFVDNLVFPASASQFSTNNDITGLEVNSITFQAAYTVSGNALTLDSAGLSSTSGTTTGSLPMALNNNNSTVPVAVSNGSTVTLSGALSNAPSTTDGLNQTGAGTLVLSGANTYSGATSISGGTLSVGADNSVPSGSAVTVASGTTLGLGTHIDQIASLTGPAGSAVSLGNGSVLTDGDATSTAFGGVISGSGGLTKAGAGTLTLTGANSYTGGSTINAGIVALGAANTNNSVPSGSAVSIAGGATLSLGGSNDTISSLAGAGNVSLGGGTLTAGDATSTGFSGTISGSGGLTKAGAGTITLSGPNSYGGATNINAGTVAVGADNSVPPGSAVTVASGATLSLGTHIDQIASLTGPAGSAIGLGNGSVLTDGDATSTAFGGVISGSGGLTKVGSGTLTLSGPNSYGGATTINVGTLAVGADNSVPSGSGVTLGGTATLSLGTQSDQIASLNGPAGTTVSLGTGSTLTLGDSTTTANFGGAISGGGTSGLTKVGTGTQKLSGTSTYSGPTLVSAGTLLVDGTIGSSVSVGAGAVLSGIGTVGGITVPGSGAVSPGDSTGTMNASSASFSGTSSFNVTLNSAVDASQLKTSGAATLSSAALNITLGYTPSGGDSFTILQSTDSTVSGTFAGKPDATVFSFTSNGHTAYFRINYTAHTVTLTAVVDATGTGVSCAPNPDPVGTTTTCTATVTDTAGGGVPTGNVTFSCTSPSCPPNGVFNPNNGVCTLSATGAATSACSVMFTPSATPPASITIHAAYPGDTYHLTSSGDTSLTVTAPRSTTTTVSCTPASIPVNSGTSCKATVTDTNVGPTTPTGTVTFSVSPPANGGFTPSTQCTLAQVGMTPGTAACSVTYTPTATGSPSVTGTYGGDQAHAGSNGSSTVTVYDHRHTSTSVTCVPGTVVPQNHTTCMAVVTDSDQGTPSAPGGTVTFSTDGSGTFSSNTCALGANSTSASNCQVTYTPTTVGSGTHNILGSYSGEDGTTPHAASSGSFALTVHARSTTTTVGCLPATVAPGVSTTCTATVTDTDTGTKSAPPGTVALSSNGSGAFTGSPCTLSGSGSSTTCQATYTPSATGAQTIGAAYTPNDGIHGASASSGGGNAALTVNARATSTTVSCTSPVAVNSASTCTATVTDTDAGTQSAPGGTVAFSSNGSGAFSGSPCTLSGGGPSTTCQATYTPSATGAQTISAAYTPNDGVHGASASSGGGNAALTVNARATSTTVSCTSPVLVNSASTCMATVSDIDAGTKSAPGGTVAFSSNGSGAFTGSPCTLSGSGSSTTCQATFTPSATGTQIISGAYTPNDSVHSASASSGGGNASLTVNPRSTSTNVGCAPPAVNPGSPTTCTATVSDTDAGTPSAPGGTVAFSSDGGGAFSPGTSCTLSGGNASSRTCSVTYTPSAVGSGTHNIHAGYGGDAAHAVSSGSTALTVSSQSLVAGVGSDNAMWVRQGGGYTSLGGILLAAPALVSVPNGNAGVQQFNFIATGNDHDLWVRTLSAGWQRLDAQAGAYCIDNPAAAAVGSTLYVACQGGDHQLWLNSATVTPGVLPTFANNGWHPLGGSLAAGPAMANVPGRGLDIMTVGPNNGVTEYYGTPTPSAHSTTFTCSSHPALATNPGGTTAYFACHGSGNSLWWSQNSGGTWSSPANLGGILIDGPGIAVSSQGPTFYVEGGDQAVWERTLTVPFSSDGGVVNYGVGAGALS